MIDALRRAAFLLVPLHACAQQGDSIPFPHRVVLEGSGSWDSNTLNNALMLPLLFGGDIAREERQDAFDRMARNGRAGVEAGGRLFATWGQNILGHANWQMRTALGWQFAIGTAFTPDAFALTFLGNAAYENTTMHLAPFRAELWHYQSLGVGLEDALSGSYLELAMVNGTTYAGADLEQADLFTATDGRWLDLDVEGLHQRSDTAPQPGPTSGLGAAINARWSWRGSLLGKPSAWSVEILDAGFVAWNGDAVRVERDTSIRFEGVPYTDVFNVNGPPVERIDLQDSLGLDYDRSAFLRPLPFRLRGMLHWGERKRPGFGEEHHAYALFAEQRRLPGYLPHVQAKRYLALAKSWTLDVGAGYGGFGGARLCMGLTFADRGGLTCSLMTSNALGTAATALNGRAVEFSLQFRH
jgi:hypothetical protein